MQYRYYRALRVERLEVRASPGVLLSTGGLFGLSLFDLNSAPATTRRDERLSTDRSHAEEETRPSNRAERAVDLDALRAQESAHATARSATQITTGVPIATRAAFAPAFLGLNAPDGVNPNSAATAPILKTSTLPDPARPSGSSGGGGGGGASAGGGGGNASPRGTISSAGSQEATTSIVPTAPPSAAAPLATQTSANASAATPSAAPADSTTAWAIPTGIGQCAPPAGNPAASFDNSTASGLQLVDAAGQPLNIAIDSNTLIIGAATWCGNTAKLKAQLSTPEAQQALNGMRIVWAFGDEGGSGPGGVLKSEFLDNLPGTTAFLGENSVRPWRFPSAFNGATGQFDVHPLDVIESWLSRASNSAASNLAGPTALKLNNASGQPLNLTLDSNTIVLAAASWCPHCAEFKATLSQPDAQADLKGLRLIFAFTDEGGSGPGGVTNAEFLQNIPGEVAFLASDSIQPPAFPMAFNPTTGQFDTAAMDAVSGWYWTKNSFADSSTSDNAGGVAAGAGDLGSGADVCVLPGDFNRNGVVDAADYVLWREQQNQMGAGLAADANGDQTVNEIDYGIWRAHFGEVCQVPGEFMILGPTGVQNQKDITITWEAASGATSYRFTISKNANLSSPLLVETLIATSRDVFVDDGTYYIGVAAINESGETLASNNGTSFSVAATLPSDQLIFVTATTYTIDPTDTYPPNSGSFGSAQSGDYQCTAIANANGLLSEPWDGVKLLFRALLTESSIGLTERAGIVNDRYYNTLGIPLASDRADLLAGNRTAPILTQARAPLTGTQLVWTGGNPDFTASGSNCVNWTRATGPGSTARVGNLNGTGTDWISQGSINCTSAARLYCVGTVQRTTIADFESGVLPDGWTQSGNAWIVGGTTGTTPNINPIEGSYFARSGAPNATSETNTGVLTSSALTVVAGQPILEWQAVGWSGPAGNGQNRFEVLDATQTSVLATIAAPLSDQWQRRTVDLRTLGLDPGETFYFRAIDNMAAGNYSWLAFDHLSFTTIA
ncbi:MAG: dockerin type I domain-containing protein [Pirellulales bacterium]